jgi:phosphoribosylformimino-5-aminoimidazole carboxamide ribotide isomerase
MEIIPVIDLKGGAVVRARLGERQQYRPIETPLSPTSDPLDVARGLLSLHRFRTLYVADLDAIERRGGNCDALGRLRAAFPQLTLWVDNGIADATDAAAWLAADLGHLVLGSETQSDPALVSRFGGHDRVVLSLDFRAAAFQGPPELLDTPSCWPRRVIVMTLARVGSGAGPDFGRLAAIRVVASGRAIYAAGGTRDAADLVALERLGIAGALVASSLHDGRLGGAEIAALENGAAARGEPPAPLSGNGSSPEP